MPRSKKPKKIPYKVNKEKRRSIKKIALAVGGPVAVAIGIGVLTGRRGYLNRKRRAISERSREFNSYGLANPETWARIFERDICLEDGFNFNPGKGDRNRKAIDSINAISRRREAPVERVLLTLGLNKNKLNGRQVDALQNKIDLTRAAQKRRELENERGIIASFLRLSPNAQNTIRKWLETPNNLKKLRNEFGLR